MSQIQTLYSPVFLCYFNEKEGFPRKSELIRQKENDCKKTYTVMLPYYSSYANDSTVCKHFLYLNFRVK